MKQRRLCNRPSNDGMPSLGRDSKLSWESTCFASRGRQLIPSSSTRT